MASRTTSGYEKVTRNMVENLASEFNCFKADLKSEFKELRDTNTHLYNHLSSRVQPWVMWIMTVGGSLITGLVVWGLSR